MSLVSKPHGISTNVQEAEQLHSRGCLIVATAMQVPDASKSGAQWSRGPAILGLHSCSPCVTCLPSVLAVLGSCGLSLLLTAFPGSLPYSLREDLLGSVNLIVEGSFQPDYFMGLWPTE